MSDDARDLIARLDARNFDAAQLAVLASLAVEVEPELLRALRGLIADADAGAEADVWLSDLVESKSPLAMVFRADVRARLQEMFVESPDPRAFDVIEQLHSDGSDVVRIEEKVTKEALAGDAGNINALLAPIIAAMESEPRSGLARWAARAFDAMPLRAKQTESAWRMMRVAAETRATPREVSVSSEEPSYPHRTLNVRLRRDALLIEERRPLRFFVGGTARTAIDLASLGLQSTTNLDDADAYIGIIDAPIGGTYVDREFRQARRRELPAAMFVFEQAQPLLVEIEYVSVTSIEEVIQHVLKWEQTLRGDDTYPVISVPDTNPLLLEVSWQNRDERQTRRLAFHPGDRVVQPLRPRHVTVRTIAGETFTLNPLEEVEDLALVIGIEKYELAKLSAPDANAAAAMFFDWLRSMNVPAENIVHVQTEEQLNEVIEKWPAGPHRRCYVYFAGLARPGNRPLIYLDKEGAPGAFDVFQLASHLGREADELVIVVDAVELADRVDMDEGPQFTQPMLAIIGVADLAVGITGKVIEGLNGAAAMEDGPLYSLDVAGWVQHAIPWAAVHGAQMFVLREHVEVQKATLHLQFPRPLVGSEAVLVNLSAVEVRFRIEPKVTLMLRPGVYKLEVPDFDIGRVWKVGPGEETVSVRWEFNGHWIIVAGTASPELRPEERLMCEAIARGLADRGYGLCTGMYRGVDEHVSEMYASRVSRLGGSVGEAMRRYALPEMDSREALVVQDDYEAPLRQASALILIGGADGVFEYAKRAAVHQLPIFPIPQTARAARKIAQERQFHLDGLDPRTPALAAELAENLLKRIDETLKIAPA